MDYLKKVIDIYVDFFARISPNVRKYSQKHEAKLIFQILFAKLLTIRQLLDGVSFKINGAQFRTIIDPISFIAIVRTIYEWVCAFEVVYVIPDTDEKREIVYALWYMADLKHRMSITNEPLTGNVKNQVEAANQSCVEYENKIRSTAIYGSLPDKEQKKIDAAIKNKDYKIRILDNRVEKLSWQGISDLLGQGISYQNNGREINISPLKDMYYRLCSYAHPSQFTVKQWNEWFKEDKEYEKNVTLMVKQSLMLLSLFLADFIKLFPETKRIFLAEDIVTQMTLDCLNYATRGNEFVIDIGWIECLK
jgi:hypothetical protein